MASLAAPSHTDVSSGGGYAPAAPTRTKPKPPRKKPPAVPPTPSSPFADLTAQAAAQAKAQIDAEIAAITGQQQSELGNARDQAKQLSLASLAGANLIHGFGTPVADAYSDAAKTLAALAQGYTGNLRASSAADAAAVQHDLDVGNRAQGANSVPGPGSAPGQQAIDHGDALANYLYGAGAAQPATSLLAGAGAAAAREGALPTSIIGYGQELGVGTLAAARKAVEALAPQILATRAKLPSLQSSILSDLANTEAKLGKANAPKILGSSSSGYYAFDPATGKMTQILGPSPGSTRAQVFSSGGDEYAIDPTSGKVTRIVDNPSKASGGSLKAVKTAGGTALVDPHTGKVVEVLPPAPSTSTKGTLSPTAARTFVASLGKTVTLKDPTGKTLVNPDGTPQTKTTHRLRYMAAYNFLRRHGVSDVDARTQLSTSYARGQDGRSWLSNEEQAVLARTQKALSSGRASYVGTGVQRAAISGLTKIRTTRDAAGNRLGYLTPDQYAVLSKAGLNTPVEAGQLNGATVYWIQPNG